MTKQLPRSCTAFVGDRLFASGPLVAVVSAIMARGAGRDLSALAVFDDASGAVIDLDLRGSVEDAIRRLREADAPDSARPRTRAKPSSGGRGRGRPKLGVVPREVTLLPRQWDWLAAQPGSVSQVLRKLVDEARRADRGQAQRTARERAYRFLSAQAGNLPGYEEALRALFAGDAQALAAHMAAWPQGIRDFALRLAEPDPVFMEDPT